MSKKLYSMIIGSIIGFPIVSLLFYFLINYGTMATVNLLQSFLIGGIFVTMYFYLTINGYIGKYTEEEEND